MQLYSLLLAVFLTGHTALATLPIRLVTFNIRYDASGRESGEKPWFDIFCWASSSRCREPHVVSMINSIVNDAPSGAPTVIGLQEVLNNQLKDIKNDLDGNWDHVGVARDDGSTKGEYAPILYRTDQLRVIAWETKWLSPTPDQVSFDNVSAQARQEGIKVALTRIQQARAAYGPLAVSLTGDFNSSPYSDAFQTLANTGFFQGEMYDLAQPNKVSGALRTTYTTFEPDSTPGSRIDFIWLGAKDGFPFTVDKYEIMDNNYEGMIISDHRPVVGDVTLL
ncbi:unnamed protein product [Periconia digitata]|uniref:Endonuclease/exonuclease/phosphatase domain-containing protein n=1 Tax=Periconia digitata TaxID=1303443 RepID=A0A9W4U5J5_9PLEO|nr:unnamed protein product [Periconia digitata]